MKKYYEAYNDRYEQVHKENLRWFSESHSPILSDMLSEFQIRPFWKLLEIGCGEGRDAGFLLKQGYDLLATDISSEAIAFCKRENPWAADRFRVFDCLKDGVEDRYDFIYAIAVLHMLVQDEDRGKFYQFIRNHLSQDGIALICTMGDGVAERKSDIANAFTLQRREHQATGRTLHIASTSYRAVSFETFDREIEENGFVILKQGITVIEPDYGNMMYAVVKENTDL